MSLTRLGESADSSYQLSERLRKANARIEQLEAALRELVSLPHDMGWIKPGEKWASIQRARALLGEAP